MRAVSRPVVAGLFVGLLVLGCTKPPAEAVVAGEVLLDNAPLPKGMIRFIPTDGALRPMDAEVVNGKFEARVSPGEWRVEITAPKVTRKKKMYDTPDSPEVDEIAELLPVRFNVQSTLTMTVTAGRQEKRFEVQGK